MKMTTERLINKSKIKHNNFYDYSKTVYINSTTKIIVICPEHKDFLISPYSHLNGHGCKECQKISIKKFLDDAKKKFGEQYDYSKITKISAIKNVEIICRKHGPFFKRPSRHLTNIDGGCPECAKELAEKDFINRAIKLHKDRYDYSKTKFINMQSPITITCRIHGDFTLSRAENHLIKNKGNCKQCTKKIRTYTLEYFIEKSSIKHNNYYNYSKSIYINKRSEILIICPEHGEFWQVAGEHMRGRGCPKCPKFISTPSQIWLDYLNVPKEYREIKLIMSGHKFIVDAYDPITNTVYEFWGDFWHGNPAIFNHNEINAVTKCSYKKLYQKTIDKINLIKCNGYNLIDIWENDWNILKNTIRSDTIKK